MIKTGVVDGLGSRNTAGVDDRNFLRVVQSLEPPLIPQKVKPFSQFLTDDGTASGSNDMIVNGSSTPQEFHVCASQDGDLYITSLSLIISDAGAALNEFGNFSALSNGSEICYNNDEFGDVVIHTDMTSNFDHVRAALFNPPFGSGANSFRGSNVVGTSEAFMPIFDLTKIIPPYGVKLDHKTNQKLIFRIRDNIPNVDEYTIKAFGFVRVP